LLLEVVTAKAIDIDVYVLDVHLCALFHSFRLLATLTRVSCASVWSWIGRYNLVSSWLQLLDLLLVLFSWLLLGVLLSVVLFVQVPLRLVVVEVGLEGFCDVFRVYLHGTHVDLTSAQLTLFSIFTVLHLLKFITESDLILFDLVLHVHELLHHRSFLVVFLLLLSTFRLISALLYVILAILGWWWLLWDRLGNVSRTVDLRVWLLLLGSINLLQSELLIMSLVQWNVLVHPYNSFELRWILTFLRNDWEKLLSFWSRNAHRMIDHQLLSLIELHLFAVHSFASASLQALVGGHLNLGRLIKVNGAIGLLEIIDLVYVDK
jgi:hypothetical protein